MKTKNFSLFFSKTHGGVNLREGRAVCLADCRRSSEGEVLISVISFCKLTACNGAFYVWQEELCSFWQFPGKRCLVRVNAGTKHWTKHYAVLVKMLSFVCSINNRRHYTGFLVDGKSPRSLVLAPLSSDCYDSLWKLTFLPKRVSPPATETCFLFQIRRSFMQSCYAYAT